MGTYIDFLTLPILVNSAAFYLASKVLKAWYNHEIRNEYSIGFILVGFLQTILGFYTIFTWPLNGVFNIAYGEPLVYFGSLLICVGICFQKALKVENLSIFFLLGSLKCFAIGAAIIYYSLSADPVIVGLLFLGVGATLLLTLISIHKNKSLNISAMLFLVMSFVWAVISTRSYFLHLNPNDEFGKWKAKTTIER
jgi:putative membrane protein